MGKRLLRRHDARDDVSGVPSGVWDIYEQARLHDPVLDGYMMAAESGQDEGYAALKAWSLENETGIETTKRSALPRRRADRAFLPGRHLDWGATVDLAESIEATLDELSEDAGDGFTLRLSRSGPHQRSNDL